MSEQPSSNEQLYDLQRLAVGRRLRPGHTIKAAAAAGVAEIERLERLLATTLNGEEGIHVSTGQHGPEAKLFSARDVQAFTAIGFALRKKYEAERAAVEPAIDQAEIVTVRVENGEVAEIMMKAPGLPDGTHDLYCAPPAMHDGDHLERFTAYVVKEMPPGTIIGNPQWWARRLLAAACVTAPEAPTPPPGADAEDAAKWRALRNCARITAMGCAGIVPGGDSYSGPTAHVTLNFWTHNEREQETWHREWLDAFVAKARAVETKGEGR